MSSVPVFIYSSLNWHLWMWWIKQYWFGKTFDFYMNLLVHSSQSYQLTSRVLFMLSISVSFQHGFQGDSYQKVNIFCFSCQQYAAVISVSNLVPTAVVVSLRCPSHPSLHICCSICLNFLCVNVIRTYTKLTWDAEHYCSCFDSTDCINILQDRVFLSGFCIFWLHIWVYENIILILLP